MLTTTLTIKRLLEATCDLFTAEGAADHDLRDICMEVLESCYLPLCPETCIERRVDAFLAGRSRATEARRDLT